MAIFARDGAASFAALAAAPPAGKVIVHARGWEAEDLTGAALAIGDIEDGTRSRPSSPRPARPARPSTSSTARLLRFLLRDARQPLAADRGDLDRRRRPVFGQAIRTRIETLLPATLKAWAQAAKDWRPAVQARELPFAMRRAFWELFTDKAMGESGRLPADADRTELFAALERIEADPGRGRVSLVGAGPATRNS